jgi:hypothetical protein
MEKRKLTDVQIIIRQRIIIWVLAGILIAGSIFIFVALQNEDFWGGGKPGVAKNAPDQITKFRKKLLYNRSKSFGVWFDIKSFKEYMDSFPYYIDTTASEAVKTKKIDIDSLNLKWVIGFYWMLKKDSPTSKDSVYKHDFCMVPTLVDKKDPRNVKDYFNTANDRFYYHGRDSLIKTRVWRLTRGDDDDPNPYDEGQLWP